jgi:L-lactate dehydrogenase complex protein LldE
MEKPMPEIIQLFVTCILDTLYPDTAEAVVRVLERAGVQVALPGGQTCCGQPAFNAGLRQQARPIAMHTIEVFEKTKGWIIVPSGSCADMMRHGYLELFADDPHWLPRAQVFSKRILEFTEFLVDHLGIVDLGARFPGKITYHSSCHLLRDMGIDRQPRALLAAVQEAEFVELAHTDECCGFGGVFSVEQPQLSAAMLERKIANIDANDAETIVVCDAGCMTNINGGLHRRGKKQHVVHIAEILNHF